MPSYRDQALARPASGPWVSDLALLAASHAENARLREETSGCSKGAARPAPEAENRIQAVSRFTPEQTATGSLRG
jgi:hypothetical protein